MPQFIVVLQYCCSVISLGFSCCRVAFVFIRSLRTKCVKGQNVFLPEMINTKKRYQFFNLLFLDYSRGQHQHIFQHQTVSQPPPPTVSSLVFVILIKSEQTSGAVAVQTNVFTPCYPRSLPDSCKKRVKGRVKDTYLESKLLSY